MDYHRAFKNDRADGTAQGEKEKKKN